MKTYLVCYIEAGVLKVFAEYDKECDAISAIEDSRNSIPYDAFVLEAKKSGRWF